MTANEITGLMVAEAEWRAAHKPEAITVLVTTDDQGVASRVAPLLVSRLYQRRGGRVLHLEATDEGTLVTIEDLGVEP